MGVSSSSNNKDSNQSSGNHFQSIIQTNRNNIFNKLPSNSNSNTTSSEDKKNVVELDKRANVIKRIDYRLLWDNFLSENYESFSISTSQLKPLLSLSIDRSIEDNDKRKYSDEAFKSDIDSYVELLVDLNGRSETIDFISVISSVIILNYQPIESKIDVLYFYITFDINEDSTMQFDEFYLAIKSFENGVSNCLGHAASSEDYLRMVASQWLALADPNHKGSADRSTKISKKNFFDFCINRQHVVRRLLEAIGQAETISELTPDVSTEESIYNSSNVLEKAPSGGDEWMANPPWKKVAERMKPSTAKNNNSPPSSSLNLSWVHGYRGFDCRNNVFSVSVDGSHILFHTAALVVCQYSGSNDRKQSYFNMHTDDIVAMAIASHPSDSIKRLVASGQIGKTPTIYVSMWCLDENRKDSHFESLVCCKGYHNKGVAQLAFSGDSKRMLSIGVEYTVAVYNTDVSVGPQELGRMMFSSQGPKDKVLHCCSAGNQMKSFISCGEKHVIFWSNNSSSYTQIIGKLGSEKSKLFLSAVSINDTAVAVGTADGDIYICKVSESKDCVLLPSVKSCLAIHAKGVTCLSVDSSRTILISGGKDGKANVWRINSEDGVSLLSLQSTVYTDTCSLRSICLSDDGIALIISNINCDIKSILLTDNSSFKLLTSSKSVQSQISTLVSAHSKEELWGLCIVPKSYKFITVGDDGFLKVWDVSFNRLLESFDLQLPSRCCAVSPDGVYLAVGFNAKTGKGKAKQSQGVVKIFRLESLLQEQVPVQAKLSSSLVLEIKEAKQSISCIKFSPNGTILTVGSRDNSIYHYSVVQQFKFKSKFSKHNSGILGFDFSSCGKYLVSYCSAYELLYSDVNTGSHITKAESLLKEIDWESCTCSLGWSVTGLWRGGMDGSDINSVDRSPCRQLIASGEDSGKLCMFRYPAMTEGGSQHIEYSGHSSHITNVRWLSMNNSQYLISCGGNDKSVFVWSCDSYQVDSNDKSTKLLKSEIKSNSFDVEESFDLPGGGDEFLAVKPWLGAIVPPTAWSNPDPTKLPPYSAALSEVYSLQRKLDLLKDEFDMSVYESLRQSTLLACQKMSEACTVDSCTLPPCDDLELDWVHGYRGFDSRNNSYFLSIDSELIIVYPAAGLIVIMNYQKLTQRYFRGHTDDVLCLAYCKDSSSNHLVASGQVGKGNTYVWDPTNIKTLATLNTKQKTVVLLSFSNDGKFLVTIAEDKSIAVSDWKAGNVLINTQGEASVSHHLSAINNNGVISFINSGDKFVKIWTVNGRNITGTKISTSPLSKPQAFLCGVSVGNKIIIGAEDGYLYVSADNGKSIQGKWPHVINATSKELAEQSASKSKAAAVTALTYNNTLGLLGSGSRNGSVCLWNCLRNNFDTFEFDPKDKTRKLELSAADVCIYFRLEDVSGLKDAVCKQVHNLSIKAGLGSDDVLVLIGTKGCDLFIVQCNKGSSNQPISLFTYQSNKQSSGFITRCHYADELWGLTTHPVKPEFITVGDDKTMRVFSLKSKKQLAICNLGLMARCCTYHPINPSIVAVGFGGRVGRGKESGGGIIRVYKLSQQDNSIEFVKLAEKADSKQWISDIKFSGDGRVIVASAHDCKIYIYDVYLESDMSNADLKLRHVFAKHNSVVNHIDLSIDGAFMQSNCSAYELLFCDISSGKQITSATELKDVRWSDWTCPLGWPVQGIWSGNMDGSDINAVDRSHTGHLLAVGDDFGAVSLYRYPCPKSGAGKNTFQGHSSHVMNVRWSVGDEYLISCGGGDKCIFQWKHVISESSQVNKHDNNTEIVEINQSEFHEPSGGDESGAIKPWLGAIKPPKFPPPINKSAPLIKLNLEWVYGYCSSAAAGSGGNKLKVSNNLYYNTNGQLVYPAASLGIIQESLPIHGKRSQKYFQGHDDDVLCLSISHNRRFAVTGQTASKSSKGKGSVIVWDAVDGRVLTRMDGCHQRGVAVVCFNEDDSQLLSIGLDDTNTHILWSDTQGNWSRADKVAEEKGDKGTVLFSRFISSKNALRQKGDSLFVSGGSGSINFWRLEGAKLSKKQGKWGKAKSPSAVLCCGNIMSKDMKYRIVVGTSSGELLVFDDNKEVVNIVDKAHLGPVVSICEGITSSEILFLITGGKDHNVKVWNQSLQLISSFDATKYSLIDGAVTSVDYWTDLSTSNIRCVAIGTSGGEILQLDLSNNDSKSLNITDATVTVEMHSHSSGELWGVSPHPIDPNIVATVGDEGTLRIWSTGSTDESFALLGHVCLGWAARSVAWHPSGTLIAIGFMESVKGGVASKKKDGKGKAGGNEVSSTHSGAVHLYSVAINGKEVSLIKISDGCSSTAWIQEVRFSPDGSLLAVCSHDKHMYVYSIPTLSAEQLKTCLIKPKYDFNKHSSAVLHVDFSSDGLYFQTNCQAGELLFGNAENGRQETSATKLANYNNNPENEEDSEQGYWISQTCKLGWSVQGIFGSNIDLSDVNSVDRHHNFKVIATADDFGLVKVFRYPCIETTSEFVVGKGHSSHVTNVRWTSGDQLVSVGGNDKCLFVWKMFNM